MLQNHLKTAWRSLRKNKTFSALNIIGLSIGVACSLLIALYVLDELNYDRFNTRADRIYRIDEQVRFGDFSYNGAETPPLMGPVFARDFKTIEQYARLKANPGVTIRKSNESFSEEKAVYADSTLFDVFSLDMIAGDKTTALKAPHRLTPTNCLVGDEQMVAGFCLSDQYRLVDVCGSRRDLPADCHYYDKLPGDQGSRCQSGEEPAGGLIKILHAP